MRVLFAISLILLSGCSQAPAESSDEVVLDDESAPHDPARDPAVARGPEPDAAGWTNRSYAGASPIEAGGLGYASSIGRGIHIVDLQAIDGMTDAIIDVEWSSDADAELYARPPVEPCGGSDRGYDVWLIDDSRVTATGSGGASLDLSDLLEDHACGQPCAEENPEYGSSCNTWMIGLRVQRGVGFSWSAVVSTRMAP